MGTPDHSPTQYINELESALQAAQAERDAALHELDEIARYLSHDLRAPLRGIDGYSKALIEDYGDGLEPLALAYLEYINESGRQAASVLDQLILYIRTPRAELQLDELDISALAEEIGAKVEQRHAKGPNQCSAQLKVAPGMVAQADERLVRLLLDALLDNAWKFSRGQAQPQIQVNAERMQAATVFRVQDHGAGFDPAFSSRLFQPFQRLHSAHEFEGVGMGLALARRIVERHSGRIWAQGEVNCGATVFFTLESNK